MEPWGTQMEPKWCPKVPKYGVLDSAGDHILEHFIPQSITPESPSNLESPSTPAVLPVLRIAKGAGGRGEALSIQVRTILTINFQERAFSLKKGACGRQLSRGEFVMSRIRVLSGKRPIYTNIDIKINTKMFLYIFLYMFLYIFLYHLYRVA